MLAIRTGARMAQDGLEGDDRPHGGHEAERTLDNRRSGRKSLVLVAMTVHDFADREWHVVSRHKFDAVSSSAPSGVGMVLREEIF